MKKIGLIFLMVICLLVAVPFQGSATSLSEDSVRTEKIKLKLTYISIPILDNQYFIRSETFNSVKVEVFDSNSDELVNTYGEIIENTNTLLSSNGSYSIVTTYKESTDGPPGNQSISRLTVKMNVYSAGGFRQINSILSTSMSLTGGSDATLESIDAVSISSTNEFPTTAISANGTGVLTTKHIFEGNIEMQLEAGKWKYAGFSVTFSGGVGFEFYARKQINLSLNYSLY